MLFFTGNKRIATLLTTAFLPVFAVGNALAGELEDGKHAVDKGIVHELKLGFLKHDVSNLWSSFSRENGWDLNLEISFTPSVTIWSGSLRPVVGGSWNNSGNTDKVYVDGRWQYDFANNLYTGVGVGVALHNGERWLVRNDRKALGSKLLLHFPLELGYRLDDHHNFSLYFDHMSNAYTQPANEGMDSLGIRYGYRF